MIRVVLIDDHPLAINGIGAWLAAAGRFVIAGTAGTVAQARSLPESLDPLPDAAILDIALARKTAWS
jgi:NarL family two-component system response regulator LiaR